MNIGEILNRFISHRNALESSQEDAQAFMEFYHSRLFSVRDAMITPKRFHDWLREGLLPMEIPEGKKNLMSLPEFIWVKLVSRLRQVGTPLEHIRELKGYLFAALDPQRLIPDEGMDMAVRTKFGQFIDRSGMSEEEQELLRDELDSDTPFAVLAGSKQTLFDSILMRLLTSSDEAGVMLMPNGYFQVWLESLGEPRMNLTHVYLSISEELNLFRSYSFWEERAELLSHITDEEWQVIWAIRDRRAREVTVTFMEKGEERRMDITTTHQEELDPKLVEKIIDLVKLGKYTDLRLKTQGNNSLFVERKRRKRL